MLLRKKGQSTAEYAAILGIVLAVIVGVVGAALKGGIRQKNTEAMNYLLNQKIDNSPSSSMPLYTQEYRQTTVNTAQDHTTMQAGGAETRTSSQGTGTSSTTVETLDKQN